MHRGIRPPSSAAVRLHSRIALMAGSGDGSTGCEPATRLLLEHHALPLITRDVAASCAGGQSVSNTASRNNRHGCQYPARPSSIVGQAQSWRPLMMFKELVASGIGHRQLFDDASLFR